jgi:succinate dehydrogenase hydrophobic anchor subunit
MTSCGPSAIPQWANADIRRRIFALDGLQRRKHWLAENIWIEFPARHRLCLHMIEFDVFISYPHQNKPEADAACGALEAAGVRCWIAPRDIDPGAEWASAIVEALDHCRVMILIFSSHANQSKQIRREVQRAFDREVPVVPLRVEDVVPEKSLAYFMGPVHWLDALPPPFAKHLQQLVSSVVALARAQPVTTPPPVPARPADGTTPPAPVYSKPVTEPPDPPAASAAPTRPSILWDLLDYITAIFLSVGTFLLAWWLTAASTGPSRFAQIAWLTRNPVGQLILACYCLLILFHSLRRILMLIRPSHFGPANSTGANLNYEDYANVANAPLVIAFAALLIQLFDASHARVVFLFESEVVTLPMLLFALTVPVQTRAFLRSIVDRHVRDNSLRPPFHLAITFLSIAAAATMIYAIFRINFAP